MFNRPPHILGSFGFLTGLLLLLLNDFVLKEQFHNGFTGKLSDFAGLFIFPLFWTAFFPRRKLFIFISTAVLFVFWKSAYSQFVIEGWNDLPFFGIQRTVDYSDLCALLILPLSYRYSGKVFYHSERTVGAALRGRPSVNSTQGRPRRAAPTVRSETLIYLIAIVSLFAFTATQFSHKVSFNNQYQFGLSKTELLVRISYLPKNEVSDSFWTASKFDIQFDSCNNATITVEERGNQSVITLKEMDYRCPSEPKQEEMRKYFEKEFIDKLRGGSYGESSQISYVWPK